jgi:hypothetical protein
LRAGALLGLAVLTELPAGLGAAVLAVYAAVRAGPGGRLRGLALLAAGALPPLAVLGAYQTAAFGHPLRTGYAYVVYPTFAAGMASGWLGISWPRPAALFGMLIGRSRGLLYLSPVLALGFVGLVRGFRQRQDGALAVVIALMLLNASYYMWWGGAALGPRHLVPALPFLAIGLPLAFSASGCGGASPGPLLLISVVNQLVAVAVSALVPFGPDVLLEHAYPHLLAGRVAMLPGASNLGLILGLHGWVSLLPLVALWLFGLAGDRPGAAGTRPGRCRMNPAGAGRSAWPLGLVALVAAVHGASLRHGFVYDDAWTVLDNPVIRDPGNAARLFRPPADPGWGPGRGPSGAAGHRDAGLAAVGAFTRWVPRPEPAVARSAVLLLFAGCGGSSSVRDPQRVPRPPR